MTNEEKANEICMNIVPPYTDFIYQNYKTAMKMAEWKDEQFAKEKQALIDKACEWLEDNAINYVGKDGITAWRSVFADFRKAMKGE